MVNRSERRRIWTRRAAVVLCGGCLLQVGGCATIFGPNAVSIGESLFLTLLLGGVI